MRLWVRLALGMALVALVPVGIVGWLSATTAARSVEEDSKERLHREAVLHAEVVGRWMAEQQAHAEAWTQVFPGELPQMSDELRSGFLAAVYRGTPAAVTVVLVDGDGRSVVPPVFALGGGGRVPSTPQRSEALIRRLPLSEAQQQGTAVGDPWLPDGLGSTPSVPFAVLAASSGADGEAADAMYLGMEVQLSVADEIAGQAGPDHAIALFDASGNVLVGAGHDLVQPQLLQALLGTAADFAYGEGDGEVLGALVPVPYTEWSAVVLEPASVVREPVQELLMQVWPVVLGAGLGAVLVAVGIAGTLSRPVEDLRDAAVAVAAGAHGRQTDADRSDELGDLGRAFNHMSSRLDESRREIDAAQAEIEAFNRELQDRVAQRTRQLEEAQAELLRSGQLAAVAQVGAGLAHELNNPLAAVLGLSQVLKVRYPDEPLLSDLESEASRCREVVTDLLRFTSGEVDPEQAPVVDLREVLDEVVRLVGGAFKQRGVALELAHDPSDVAQEALPVRVDHVAASRIVAQVLHAMRAALGEGATVEVSATREDGEVMVVLVADRPLAASPARRDDWMASGLDLWVARQLLDQLNGRLDEGVGPAASDGARWVISWPEAA